MTSNIHMKNGKMVNSLNECDPEDLFLPENGKVWKCENGKCYLECLENYEIEKSESP